MKKADIKKLTGLLTKALPKGSGIIGEDNYNEIFEFLAAIEGGGDGHMVLCEEFASTTGHGWGEPENVTVKEILESLTGESNE